MSSEWAAAFCDGSKGSMTLPILWHQSALPCNGNTVNSQYITVQYKIILQTHCKITEERLWTHKRHTIPRPDRRAMVCPLWAPWKKLPWDIESALYFWLLVLAWDSFTSLFFRVAWLRLRQSHDNPSATETILENMGKITGTKTN